MGRCTAQQSLHSSKRSPPTNPQMLTRYVMVMCRLTTMFSTGSKAGSCIYHRRDDSTHTCNVSQTLLSTLKINLSIYLNSIHEKLRTQMRTHSYTTCCLRSSRCGCLTSDLLAWRLLHRCGSSEMYTAPLLSKMV